LPPQGGEEEKMEVKEVYRTYLDRKEEIESPVVSDLLIRHAKMTVEKKRDEIQKTLEYFKNQFVSNGYNEDELSGEITIVIHAYRDQYSLDVHVKVYPKMHPSVSKYTQLMSLYVRYMDDDYPKQRNEIGQELKDRVNPLIRILELERENEDLKHRLNQCREELRECEEEDEDEEGDP
jgi:hypothetical protein